MARTMAWKTGSSSGLPASLTWSDGHGRRATRATVARSPDVCEIGYTWLARSAIRTAANTEAKLLMLTHAFETWQGARVCFHTDARNQRSRTALEASAVSSTEFSEPIGWPLTILLATRWLFDRGGGVANC